MNRLRIGECYIGHSSPLFLVVEAGTTCNGDVSTALKMADASKRAGADAIKYQIIGADRFMSDRSVTYSYEWAGGTRTENMHAMFKGLEFSPAEWQIISDHCASIGIVFYATVDYLEGVDLAESLDMPAYKLSSWDCRNYPLIRRMAQTGKPLFLDLGPALFAEIYTMIEEITKVCGDCPIVLMHCSHAKRSQDLNLNSIPFLRKRFAYPVGWSADGRWDTPDLVAIGAGACVLEKRLTLDKTHMGHHHVKALEPEEFKAWVERMREAHAMLGEFAVKPSLEDLAMKSLYFTSIVADRDIAEGEEIEAKALAAKRPGSGISPIYLDRFIGRRAARSIKENEIIEWNHV